MFIEFDHGFHAMGTDVSVIVVAERFDHRAAGSLRQVESLFRREESRFSRFLPDSELSRMNSRGGLDDPSEPMWDVLQRARKWWQTTSGVFDPTILPALEDAGYDRSFEHVQLNSQPPGSVSTHREQPRFGGVVLSETGDSRNVILNDGAKLDLGGIVKGWTVDRAGELLDQFSGFLIDAGGDILARGRSISEAGWWVAVEDPMNPGTDRGYILLNDSALATSGTYRRQWPGADGLMRHHIIDPRTGLPSDSNAVSVTTCGPTVEGCEVIAKSVLVDTEGQWERVLRGGEYEVSIAHKNGSETSTPGWDMLGAGEVDGTVVVEVLE